MSAAAAPSVSAIDSATSQPAALPAMSRTGMTIGAENGSSDSTRAMDEPGSSSAPKLRKNDARMRIVSGAVTDWISSWRGTSAPANANAQRYRPKPSTNQASTTATAATTSDVTSSWPEALPIATPK